MLIVNPARHARAEHEQRHFTAQGNLGGAPDHRTVRAGPRHYGVVSVSVVPGWVRARPGPMWCPGRRGRGGDVARAASRAGDQPQATGTAGGMITGTARGLPSLANVPPRGA